MSQAQNTPLPESAPPFPPTDHLDRAAYLFGYPISHSLSPLLQRTVYSALKLNYQQCLYETPDLSACLPLLQTPKFLGSGVTMPFKVAIIPYLDSLTAEGEAIGAVNTIFVQPPKTPDGKRLLCGTNTDCIGIREAILQNISPEMAQSMKGKPGMVIGGGGASRAAVYALKKYLGCSEIYLVNRDKSEVDQVIAECESKGFGDGLKYISSVSEAESLPGPKVIVSAIPDFSPKSEEEIMTRKIIEVMLNKAEEDGGEGEKKRAILEMCYHPSPRTQIAGISKEAGWQVIEGIEAMMWQGFEQIKVWTGKEVSSFPVEEVKKLIAAKLAQSHG